MKGPDIPSRLYRFLRSHCVTLKRNAHNLKQIIWSDQAVKKQHFICIGHKITTEYQDEKKCPWEGKISQINKKTYQPTIFLSSHGNTRFNIPIFSLLWLTPYQAFHMCRWSVWVSVVCEVRARADTRLQTRIFFCWQILFFPQKLLHN